MVIGPFSGCLLPTAPAADLLSGICAVWDACSYLWRRRKRGPWPSVAFLLLEESSCVQSPSANVKIWLSQNFSG